MRAELARRVVINTPKNQTPRKDLDTYQSHDARRRVVAFLLATGMFIFTKGFSVPPTRNHDHPQLGCITPTDGRMKGVS